MKIIASVISIALVLWFTGMANATLTHIGTATYGTEEYGLIYEDDNNGQALVWLDYFHGATTWQGQMDWAAGLNAAGVLEYHWNPGVSVSWSDDWRLPSAGVDPKNHSGYTPDTATSEMGHLYYVSLGKDPWGPLGDTSPFANLLSYSYWSNTEDADYPGVAWYFEFNTGYHSRIYEYMDNLAALAVRPVDVTFSPVPEPATMLLLGLGLLGIAGVRRKLKK